VSTATSLQEAIVNLGLVGQRAKRVVLFDTLEVSIERSTMDERTIMDALSQTVQTFASIEVSAEAVSIEDIRAEVSETQEDE
jgi:hypothetical protein